MNLYYSPESHGYEIVASIDVGEAYEFDMFVVLRTIEPKDGIRKGSYFWAADSGCSCPSPFEDSDWTKATKAEVIRSFDSWSNDYRHNGSPEILEFKTKLKML